MFKQILHIDQSLAFVPVADGKAPVVVQAFASRRLELEKVDIIGE